MTSIATAATTPAIIRFGPPRRHSSQPSANAVSAIGSAIHLRKVSIHAPGLGSQRRSVGMNPMARKGSASPMPSPANSSSAAGTGSSRAAPNAAAMKGPVQGVATNAASAPVQKLPLAPPDRVKRSPTARPGTVNMPSRLATIPTVSRNSATTTAGSCN